MENTETKTIATLLQLSAYAQYIFPFGNFILPVVIWSSKKDTSKFIDYNGKQAINFQLSLLVYTIALIIIAVPVFIFAALENSDFNFHFHHVWHINYDAISHSEITGLMSVGIIASLLVLALKIVEFFLILTAAIKNSKGENYKFPLTINFIK